MLPDDIPAKGGGEEGTLTAEDIKTLQDDNERLKEENEDKTGRLDEANKQLMSPEYLEHLSAARRGDGDGGPKGKRGGGSEAEPISPEKDIDEMSNKELAGFIVQVIRKDFGKVGDMFDVELGKVNTAVADIRTAMEIDRVASANPDFWEHKKEILDLARKNPALTPTEAYKIVKHDKLAKGAADQVEADKKRGRRAASEKPGSGPVTRSTTGTKPKGFSEAFEEAYSTAFGSE